MSNERFTILYHKYVSGALSIEELREWMQLMNSEQYAGLLADLVGETSEQNFQVPPGEKPDAAKMFRSITGIGAQTHSYRAVVRRILKYAAVLLLVFAGAYLWNNYSSTRTDTAAIKKQHPPVGKSSNHNRAILTLADGTVINLDSAAEGLLASEPGAEIRKTGDGEISYAPQQGGSETVMINMIQTPKGSQYQIRLPDGSRVWLNAHTSIRFPAVFEPHQRKVSVKGEAYFEVVADKGRPFIVELNSRRSVQVLGTAFNVNNYEDEPFFRTTLINGSIKVRSEKDSLVLQENQTVNITSQVELDRNANPLQQIAWKNGIFNLDGTDVQGLLRQLSRWYDLNIVVKKNIPEKTFRGKLGRDLSLEQVMKVLKDFGIDSRLEGKNLIIQ